MRSEGSSGARDWLSIRYTGSRTSPVWTDLWTLATGVDFRLRSVADESELMAVLGRDDMLELALRRLASYVYESRSGDKVGASHMLGVAPPGGQTDIAPTWLVTAASSHSKLEHQRKERADAEARQRRPKGKGKGKDKDKGGKGGGSGASAQ